MILITGGTGKVGSPLVEQLSAAGVKFRVLSRTPSKVPVVKGAEVVKGDLTHDASLDAALAGVDKLFLLTNSFPGSQELQNHVIDRARAKGVKHVVRQSVVGAELNSPVVLSRWHAANDAHLQASGLKWTILRPGSFVQNLLGSAGTIKKDGAFYSCAKDGKLCQIDARDIAAAAAHVLTTDGHEGKTYTLTGQEPLSYAQMAERIGKYLGKPVKYVDLPPEQFKGGLVSAGLPEWLAADYVTMAQGFAQGWAATPDPTLPGLIGKVRDFADFLDGYGYAFR